jgi:hypothetical protein
MFISSWLLPLNMVFITRENTQASINVLVESKASLFTILNPSYWYIKSHANTSTRPRQMFSAKVKIEYTQSERLEIHNCFYPLSG